MKRFRLLAGATLLALAASRPASGAGIFSMVSESEILTAVNSKQYNGYVRTRLPDGSFQPETYAMGEGGNIPPPTVPGFVTYDPTIDGVKFPAIAHMIGVSLADQNYRSTPEPNATRLLIMVYWGRNIGRKSVWELDEYNSWLLGYDSQNIFKISIESAMPGYGRGFHSELLEQTSFDTIDDLRVDRYFVVLRAYDFQAAWKQRKLKLLWDTRFSLSERRHDFEKDLPTMAHTASLFFGQDSHGLVRMPTLPEGRVYIGDVKTIDDETAAGDSLSGMAGDWQGVVAGSPAVRLHIDRGGNSTFETPREHSALPARISVNGGAVVVTVPGWDVLFRGTLEGDRIKGTLSQYSQSGPLVLTRIPAQ
jgi:hypothetical protein